jgi:hypothetical protein
MNQRLKFLYYTICKAIYPSMPCFAATAKHFSPLCRSNLPLIKM